MYIAVLNGSNNGQIFIHIVTLKSTLKYQHKKNYRYASKLILWALQITVSNESFAAKFKDSQFPEKFSKLPHTYFSEHTGVQSETTGIRWTCSKWEKTWSRQVCPVWITIYLSLSKTPNYYSFNIIIVLNLKPFNLNICPNYNKECTFHWCFQDMPGSISLISMDLMRIS